MEPLVTNVTTSQPNLNFKRAITTIFIYIVVYQVAIIGLSVYFGFDPNKYPLTYYYIASLLGIAWISVFAMHAIIELRQYNLLPRILEGIFHPPGRRILYKPILYFLGCALVVLLFNYLGLQEKLFGADKSVQLKVMSFISVVILPPVLEEIIFRGYLYESMFSEFRRKNERMVVNAMLFAAAHVLFVNFIIHASVPYYIFVLGFLLAKLYEETRSLLPCMFLHLLNNAFVFCLEILHIKLSTI